MGITERKERDKQEMRKRILDAAFEMFVSEGYERTSIRNIAERIEYSPATIYLYYKDKDQLLYDVQAEAFNLLMEQFNTVNHITDPFERLRALGRVYVEFAVAHPQYYDLMFVLTAPMNAIKDHKLWENGCCAFHFLREIITACIEQGKLRFDHVDLGCLQVWSMVHGLVTLYLKQRLDVMEMSDEQELQVVYLSIDNYLLMMKA